MLHRNKIILMMIMVSFILFIFYYLGLYYKISTIESKEKKAIQSWKQLQLQEQILIPSHKYISYYKFRFVEFLKPHVSPHHSGLQIKESSQTETNEKENVFQKENQSEDCILSIPDINLEKIVYTGRERDLHLKNYELITADANMRYKNGGNYIICGHASRLYGHSLNRLQEVKKDTIIEIITKNKTEQYIVYKVNYENMYQTSRYCNQTKEKTVTIISCAKNISKESYIVIHAKIKQ